MSLERSSKPALFGSLSLSFHHSNRSIQCCDNYHRKLQIAMICFSSECLDQLHFCCGCNLLINNHIHTSQRKICPKRPGCRTIFPFTHFKTLVSLAAHSKESLLLLLDPQAIESTIPCCTYIVYVKFHLNAGLYLFALLLYSTFFLKV